MLGLDPLSPWGYEGVLMEWAKVKLTDGSWRNALVTTTGVSISFGSDMPCAFDTRSKFIAPRIAIYRSICEHLEAVGRIMDATECFRDMASELGQETDREQEKWMTGE